MKQPKPAFTIISFNQRKKHIHLGTWEERREKYEMPEGEITRAPIHRVICNSVWMHHDWKPTSCPGWEKCDNCEAWALIQPAKVLNMLPWFITTAERYKKVESQGNDATR